jgi:CelD/BcsL family acetyltransferase involved in cellulose biosynthesis
MNATMNRAAAARALPADRAEGLEFRAFQGRAGFDQLVPEWGQLLDSLPGARFFHHPQWYRAYLGSLAGDPERVWFIAAYRKGALVAIFPLHFQAYRVGLLQPRILGTIEDDEMQLADFIFEQAPANAGMLGALVRVLRRQRVLRWDELRLRRVSESSSIAFGARHHLPALTLPLCYDASAHFDTSGSFEHATEAINGKFRRNLRRLANRAQGAAPLHHRTYRDPGGLAEGLAAFLELEASGWKGDGGTSTAIRCNPAMLAFYEGLAREFGAIGGCWINLLLHGDAPIAGQFCLRAGRTLNVLKVGYAAAHAGVAPGNLLLERMIQVACDDPGIDALSLVNAPPWAKNFRPLLTGVWSYCLPNWNFAGFALHAGLLGKRVLDKHAQRRATDDAPEAAE